MATPNQQDEAMRFESSRVGSGQWAVGSLRTPPSAFRLPPLGMTLVELLVVIVLVTTLVTTVIPIISPGGDDKRLREASRNLNAYLQGAQARAIETGRPFGVAFQRLSADTERGADNAVCIRAEYVEVPPHYSGFSPTSAVRIARSTLYNPPGNNTLDGPDEVGTVWVQFVQRGTTATGMPPGWCGDLTPPQFFRPGDTLEVQGRRYTLQNNQGSPDPSAVAAGGYFPANTGTNTALMLLATPEGTPPSLPPSMLPALPTAFDNAGNEIAATSTPTSPFWTTPTPYRIYRQPVPAGGEPLEMPGSVALDLQSSVFTNGVRVFQPTYATFNTSTNDFNPLTTPVMVLFSPEGNIDRVHGLFDPNGNFLPPQSVTSTLALCVGRRELIPPKPTERAQSLGAPERFREPIELKQDIFDPIENGTLSETEAKVITDQYNWLNLDSRWVLVGGQSGSISTIATSAVYASNPDTNGDPTRIVVDEQIAAAIANASSRTTAGGR
jgi:type II secretory pathway pseudopilin PulG